MGKLFSSGAFFLGFVVGFIVSSPIMIALCAYLGVTLL